MRSQSSAIARSLRPRGPVTLRLHRREAPDATILRVSGEVDLLTIRRLGTAIDRDIRTGTGDLVVDLRSTGFVDSSGLHLLLNAQRRLTRQGRALVVVCSPGPVRRVFELARLLDTFGVVSSLSEYRRAAAARARRARV